MHYTCIFNFIILCSETCIVVAIVVVVFIHLFFLLFVIDVFLFLFNLQICCFFFVLENKKRTASLKLVCTCNKFSSHVESWTSQQKLEQNTKSGALEILHKWLTYLIWFRSVKVKLTIFYFNEQHSHTILYFVSVISPIKRNESELNPEKWYNQVNITSQHSDIISKDTCLGLK